MSNTVTTTTNTSTTTRNHSNINTLAYKVSLLVWTFTQILARYLVSLSGTCTSTFFLVPLSWFFSLAFFTAIMAQDNYYQDDATDPKPDTPRSGPGYSCQACFEKLLGSSLSLLLGSLLHHLEHSENLHLQLQSKYKSSDKVVNCAALSSSASPPTTNQHFLHLFHLQNTTSTAFASFGVNARPRSRRNSSPQPSLHYQVDPEFLYKVAAYLFGDDLVQLERAGELLTLMRYSDGLRVYIPNSSLEQFLQFLFLIHSWFETPNIETRAMIEDGFILTYVSMGKRVKFRDRSWGDIAQRVIDEPNAGGGSILSEAYSAELLGSRLLGARRIYTEMEVNYFPQGGPMTDYVCDGLFNAGGKNQHPLISVSVTRAMGPPKKKYNMEDAKRLLKKKVSAAVVCSKTIQVHHGWSKREESIYDLEEFFSHACGSIQHRIRCKEDRQVYLSDQVPQTVVQILHIWVPNGRVARLVKQAWGRIDPKLRKYVVVMCSVVDSEWVFTNRT